MLFLDISIKRILFFSAVLFFSFTFPSKNIYAQWQAVNTNTTENLYAIHSNTGPLIVTCGDGITLRSDNSGNTWTILNSFSSNTDSLIYKRSKFRSILTVSDQIYVAGHDSVTGNGVVFVNSGSPGYTWSVSYNEPGGKILAMNHFSYLVIVGENGICKRLENGIWTQLPGFTGNADYTDISLNLSNTHMYVPTSDGNIKAYNLSLETVQTFPCPQPIKKISFWGDAYRYTAMDGTKIYSGFDSPFSSVFDENTNYHGPIVPTSVSDGYIATQNGLMKRVNESWEYIISTYNMPFNDLYTLGTNNLFGVACGNNGLVVKKIGYNDATYPYVGFTGASGQCVGIPATFTPTGSLDYWYSWYINGNLVSSSPDDYFSYTFPSAGSYEVMVIGSNGGLFDSSGKTITVVDVPSGIFSYVVNNPLICKSGDAEIVINGAQPEYTYSLHRIDSPYIQIVNSASGSGTASLHSGVITRPNQYRLSVRPSIAACQVFHDDTVEIYVEQTKARFNPGLINAYTSENVAIHNTSQEAATFTWDLNVNGNFQPIGNTIGLVPLTISFTDTGTKEIRLVAESINGCKDTSVKNGPYVSEEVFNYDRCKVYLFKGYDSLLYDFYADDVHDIAFDESGGTLIAGGYQNAVFPSRNTTMTPFIPEHGGYIAKHDKHGVLKWLVYTQNSNPFNNQPIHHIEKDKTGNIYAVSSYIDYNTDSLIMHDVTGKKFEYINGFQQDNLSILSKFDSNGVFKWNICSNKWYPEDIKADTSGNIYAIFRWGASWGGPHQITGPNNQINTFSILAQNQNINTLLIKVDSSGNLYHLGSFRLGSAYDVNNIRIQTDDPGNIYVSILQEYTTGSYAISIYENNGNTTQVQNSSNQLVHCKFGNQGNLLWHTVIKNAVFPAVDHTGNSYITGQSSNLTICKYNTQCITPEPACAVFFCKLNTQGDFIWNRGIKSPSSVAGPGPIGIGKNPDEVYFALANLKHAYVPSTGPVYLSSGPNDSVLVSLSPALSPEERDLIITRYDTAGILQDFNYENFAFGQANRMGIGRLEAVDGKGVWALGHYIWPFPNATITDEYIGSFIGEYSDGYAAFYVKDFCKNGDLVPNQSQVMGCTGDNVSLIYNTDPAFPITPQTTYTLQLSDSSGGYANPTVLQTQTAAAQNTFNFVLPPANGQYSVRVISDSPQGLGYPIPITIGNAPAGVDTNLFVCRYDDLEIQAVGQADSYNWGASGGITGSSNNAVYTTTPILSEGTVYCIKEALCGINTDTFHIALLPIVPDFPSFSDSICPGEQALLPALGETNYLYMWNPPGPYIDATHHWVMQPSVSTQYEVYIEDLITGCSLIDSFYVNVLPTPAAQLSGNAGLLTCSASGSNLIYSWYLNNNLIQQGFDNTYIPTQSGTYQVHVHDPDLECVGLSNTIVLTSVGINEQNSPVLNLFPNPAAENIFITGVPASSEIELLLTDVSGKILSRTGYSMTTLDSPVSLNVSHLAAGLYFITIETPYGKITPLPFIKSH